MATQLRIRTEAGEEALDLEEFEARVGRGEIAPHCPVHFPGLSGPHWVRAEELELFRIHFSPARHTFARRFSMARFPWLTGLFIAANFAVFLAMKAQGPIDTDAMVAWGAKVAPLIGDLGQLWRLLTANFIHRDWLHIGFNVFVLFNVGGALENVYRPIDYLLLLFASALGCTLGSLVFAPDAISVGASGVAYGALGGVLVLGLRYREILPRRYRGLLGESAIPTILVFLYIGWSSPGVDNWGHLGGLLFGAATAAFLPPRLLLDHRTGLASSAFRLLPMAAVTAFLLIGGAELAAALPVLAPVHDDDSGLSVGVPTTWRRGAERFGPLAFSNGLPGLGRAAFAATPREVGPDQPLSDEVERFVKTQLRAPEAAHQLRALEVSPPVPAQVSGRDALLLRARYVDEAGPTRVRAYFVPRGELVYELVFALPEVYPGYAHVADEMLLAIHFTEPAALRQARGRAMLAPATFAPLSQLGDALAQLGEPAEAAQALTRASALQPGNHEVRARLALALFSSGRVEAGCRSAHEAAEPGPGAADPVTLALAEAACLEARGDHPGAREVLEAARNKAPTDPRLARSPK